MIAISLKDPEWVILQTLERLRSEMETEELRLEEYMTDLRRREESLRKEHARVRKKPASYHALQFLVLTLTYLSQRVHSSERNTVQESDDESLLPNGDTEVAEEDLMPPLCNEWFS